MGSRAFPLPLAGLVHTAVKVEQRAALDVTDILELSVYGEELRAHRRGTEVVVVTEARRAGRLVRVDRSRYPARHRTAAGAGGPDPAEPPADDAAGTGSSTFQLRGGPAAGRPAGRVHLYGTVTYGTVTR
ncbi:hypothetical protein [Streptomyces lydicus]|uniref:hypothetical protein n=1 Tax=Streptomyces lydicus TaxID=47763 RepID=UPI0034213D93